MSWVDAAIQSFDLEGYLAQLGANPGRHSSEVLLVCPTCGKEKLSVSLTRKAWHCWVCQRFETQHDGRSRPVAGAGGLLDLIELLEGVDRAGARRFLTKQTIYDHRSSLGVLDFEQGGVVTSQVAAIPYPDGWVPCDTSLPFLRERGLASWEIIRRYGLGYCQSGRLQGRLVFPVFERGALVYYQARAMWPPQLQAPGMSYIKALNPPRIPGSAVSSELVFNLDQACRYPEVVITEGPIDAIRVGYDAVGLFGKVWHMDQVAKMYTAGVRRVVIMFDADAHEAALEAATRVAGLFEVRIVFLHESDPGDCVRYSQEELRWLVQTAKSYGVNQRRLDLTFT